jgi:hypothetical protein
VPLDRAGEFLKGFLVKDLAWLIRIGTKTGNRGREYLRQGCTLTEDGLRIYH